MLTAIDNKDSTGKVSTLKLATFTTYTRLYFQVKSAASISISKNKSDLEQPSAGQVGGIEITQAMGIVSFWWIGPLYVIGTSNGALFDLEIMECG